MMDWIIFFTTFTNKITIGQLKMAKVNAILTLHEQGWSQRKIAEYLGIHRETVGRYVAAFSKPATSAPRVGRLAECL